MNNLASADSRYRWFVRGFGVGAMLMAVTNALSYFIRSSQWNSLNGIRPNANESIGFPWLMWEGGNTYGGLYVDYPMMALNAVVGLIVASLLGLFVTCFTQPLNQMLRRFDEDAHSVPEKNVPKKPVQFSLQGLMIATGIVAAIAAVAVNFADRKETLLAIYFAGPIVLVAMAMMPRKLAWQTRVWIIVPATFSLIAAAIGVGLNLRIEFDRVLLAIFLCWTPQSALAALLLTGWLLWSSPREERASEPVVAETVS